MAKSTVDVKGAAKAGKMFSADVVAAILCSAGTTSLSLKQYELMSSLDGTKTASGFQHDFRSVLARAKELRTRIDNGEIFEPVQPAKKRSKRNDMASPATPKKRKTADDDGTTPTKKPKVTPKARAKKAPVPDMDISDSEALPQDAADFIKQEADWAAQDFA
ncbi:hypothetical protein P153DRAFT_283831 [Dothidotthia symphoricarpi CBS 119687]|uniref:Uncharacterized protein n=1 Tax=Dothidotthia symphoricarpi CBS 119687 TaxID=1392245 RepID=A0A6A6APX7_9PLEO|nr:uncharacterized protein P153DRAFT_283831 [Dothidotthia symphoricarpi CBS 119687]KAF2133004.1 hypothetical protein P153DRAFT_283831 [Dothidotthia symphoricarpi CBS 119687]